MSFHKAYLGKRLQDLLTLAHGQMKTVYETHGLAIPVEGSSTLHALKPGTWMSLTEIARALGQSHQLIALRIAKLHKLGIVTKLDDPDDRRRSEYGLTPKGESQWHSLDRLMEKTEKVNNQLFEEIDCDLLKGLDGALRALAQQDYQTRFGTVSEPSAKEQAQI